MKGLGVIAIREFRSFFRVPLGWIVVALFAFLAAVIFAAGVLEPGAPASLRDLFGFSGWLLVPIAPAVSMRLISEELRSGTIEPLMTAPVSDGAVVVGKYLGALAFLACMVAPTLVLAGVLFAIAEPSPDPGPMLAGYLSLVVLGALYLAVGTLCSALTASQTLAFLSAMFVLLVAMLATSVGAAWAPAWLAEPLYALSINRRLGDFAKGVIDLGNVAFFVGGAIVFLTLAVVATESRRWR